MSEPLITDWINSIAALIGVPLIMWGIIKLFIKDKAQERKLSSMEKLAISQNEMVNKMNEQIQELSKQTAEFQRQSVLMQDSNELISKQVELQNDIFLHEKGTEEKNAELQKKRRLNDIKPYFVNNGGTSSSTNVSINLKNKGNTAINLDLKKVQGDFIHFGKLDSEKEIDSGLNIEIKGNIAPAGRNLDNATRNYILELYFKDIDGNKYKQVITGQKVSKPELIQPENL